MDTRRVIDIVNSKEPIPEAKLLELKSIIQSLKQLAEIRQQEMALFEEVKRANPELDYANIDDIEIDLQKELNRFLTCAIFKKHIEAIQILLEAKADPNHKDKHYGWTPLHIACNTLDYPIVDLLITAKADPNIKNEDGNETALNLIGTPGHEEITRRLLEVKANPNGKNKASAMTPLMYAAKNNNIGTTKLLLAAKADPNLMGDTRATALIGAIFHSSDELVKELILVGKAKLDIKWNTRTALEYAIDKKRLPIVTLLLKQNAFIKDPQSLFNFLKTCEPNDPNVLSCLKSLWRDLRTFIGTLDYKDKRLKAYLSFNLEVTDYLQKLQELSDIYRKKCYTAIDKATEAHMSPDVIKLITKFEAPLSRMRLFKAEEINSVLAEENKSHAIKRVRH